MAHAEALLRQRERLMAEMEALKNKISGLDLAIQLISDTDEPLPRQAHKASGSERRTGITATIQRLLLSAGSKGIGVEEAVEIAAREGISLNRSSVSSLLSRMKRAGSVRYIDRRYVLTSEHAGR